LDRGAGVIRSAGGMSALDGIQRVVRPSYRVGFDGGSRMGFLGVSGDWSCVLRRWCRSLPGGFLLATASLPIFPLLGISIGATRGV
jgi:hypothetical protein